MRLGIGILMIVALLGQGASAKLGFYPTKLGRAPRASNAAPRSTGLLYYGGPVISNARVITVFWGGAVDPLMQKELGPFYAATINSNHMEWLDQYATFGRAVDGRQGTNQHIARGSYGGEYVITPVHNNRSIDDKDIQAELELQVAKNVLPRPDQNTLYMIHFPAGMTITIEGAKSCVNFCAYHNGFGSRGLNSSVFYGVMPDFKSGACSFGCGGGGNVFDTTTAISSHELMEAITDPFPTPGDKPAFPQAWNTSGGEEIADLCTSGGASLRAANGRTYKLSEEWDNKTGRCFSGPFSELR